MGDPKKHRKKYATPSHPWKRERLEQEKELKAAYGLKNKKEIYRMDSFLRKAKSQMKKLASLQTGQAQKERDQLLSRLKRLNLVGQEATMDAVLGLEIRNIMDRRLESIVFKKGLANSIKQARQFIVHQHIMVGDRKVTSPSYLVSAAEEQTVGFDQTSTLAQEDHPERNISKREIKKELEKTKKKEKPVDEDLDMPEIPPPKEVVISDEEAEQIEEAVSKEEKQE